MAARGGHHRGGGMWGSAGRNRRGETMGEVVRGTLRESGITGRGVWRSGMGSAWTARARDCGEGRG